MIMDRPQEQEYKFGRIEIFKDQQLGRGAYGAVYKAKCGVLPCAAKLINQLLIGPPEQVPSQGKEHRLPLQRFEAECRFLSQIKHPNIVQYLETYRDQETNTPVLLMELMDESLTHFLETLNNPVLFHTQVNILYDTALALAFLHSNGITHRDLSSNNILIAGSRAKVTDFGMSRFADAAPHLASMTQCPGTPAYMPPEALSKPPKCSDKLDCFSFGVLTVQTITRIFPDPADQHKDRELFDSEGKKLQVRVAISELERRQSHISLIPVAHPLRPVAIDCLNDKDVERPSAHQICERLEQIKTTPLYGSSNCQIREGRTPQAQTQGETMYDKEKQLQDQQQIIQDQQSEIRAIKQENMELKLEIELLQTEMTQLLLKDEAQTLMQDGKMESQQQQCSWPFAFKLKWRYGPNVLSRMRRGSCTVIGNSLYINPHDSRNVFEFQCDSLQWFAFPHKLSYNNSTLTNINGILTTVGGISSLFSVTNKLISYSGQEWVELYPPMQTTRFETAVLSTATHVVVIGGKTFSGELLNTTEILNTETKVWSVASPLPFSTHLATITLCKETIYCMGGLTSTEYNYNSSVRCCQLKDLVEHSVPVKKSFFSTRCNYNAWHRLPDLPVRLSTCVTVQDCLLAIGGTNVRDKHRSNVVYIYDQERNQWVFFNAMTFARSACLATVLPDKKLFVVGGYIDSGRETDETEIASID